MGKLRNLVWLAYVPLTLGLTWLLLRVIVSISRLVTIGQVDVHAIAERFTLSALPYAGFGAVACYLVSVAFLAAKKMLPFAVFAEIASIGAAKAFGLLATLAELRHCGWRIWLSLAIGAGIWLALIERRGAWPWRRMVRMGLMAAGVYLIVRNAAFL